MVFLEANVGGVSRIHFESLQNSDTFFGSQNLAGVKLVMELEDEVARLCRELDDTRRQAREAIERTHRQYRRDLVPLKQSPVLYRRPAS